MYNVFINDKPVNAFNTPSEAYEFACAIEAKEPFEDFNPELDKVTFEDGTGVETTKGYELNQKDEFVNDQFKRITQIAAPYTGAAFRNNGLAKANDSRY